MEGVLRSTIKNLTKSDSKNVEIQLNFTPNDTSLYDTNTDFFQDAHLLIIGNVEGVKKVDYSKYTKSKSTKI